MKKIKHTQVNFPSEEIELAMLEKISAMTTARKKVSEIISETLTELAQKMEFLRSTITLRNGDYLFIEDANGLDSESIKRGIYKMGEGITGKAAAEARSIVIADISKCKDFLNRTKSHESLENISFLCVPIIYMEQVIGTISAERIFADKKRLSADLDLLETISNIISDSVALIYMRKEERNKIIAENRHSDSMFESNRPATIVGNCGAMQNVYDFIAKVSKNNECIFIRGKAGTGKELAARAICTKAGCKNFKVINCDAISPKETSIAALELDKSHTVFFDEITSIPLQLQKALSTYLKNKTTQKARVICASSLDVETMLESGKFYKPLYTIISKSSIHIPSLKDRKSDILLLAEFFLEKYNAIHSKNIKRISTPAINMMSIYSWPGNVRELENCVERAVMSSTNSTISGYNLPAEIRGASYQNRALTFGEDIDFNSMTESFERELITEALKISRGNAAKAARKLGLTERIINYKIKQYAIVPAWYKNTK